MPISDLSISDGDRAIIATAHKNLLDNRKQMISGMAAVEDSPYRRGVIVDSIINGLMDHFTELARNPGAHADELAPTGWGPGLSQYADRFVNQINLILTQLGQHAAAPAASSSAGGGRTPGRR